MHERGRHFSGRQQAFRVVPRELTFGERCCAGHRYEKMHAAWWHAQKMSELIDIFPSYEIFYDASAKPRHLWHAIIRSCIAHSPAYGGFLLPWHRRRIYIARILSIWYICLERISGTIMAKSTARSRFDILWFPRSPPHAAPLLLWNSYHHLRLPDAPRPLRDDVKSIFLSLRRALFDFGFACFGCYFCPLIIMQLPPFTSEISHVTLIYALLRASIFSEMPSIHWC